MPNLCHRVLARLPCSIHGEGLIGAELGLRSALQKKCVGRKGVGPFKHCKLTLASHVTPLVTCRCLEPLKGFEKLRWIVACSLADAKVPEADDDCVRIEDLRSSAVGLRGITSPER